MSDTMMLVSFLIAIIALVALIAKAKVHPVFALVGVVITLATVFGMGGPETIELVAEGFGNTMKSVGLIIIFGCVLGVMLEASGAAVRITEAIQQVLGSGNKIPWGIAIASTIIGIPLIADTVVIMLIPIVSVIALRTGQSMMKLGPILYLGAYVATSLIIPGPGPLAAAGVLEVNVAASIFWGFVVTVFGVTAGTFYLTTIKEYVAPKPEFVKAVVESEANSSEHGEEILESATKVDSRISAGGKPLNLLLCLLPIVLPIALIMMDAVLTNVLAENSPVLKVSGLIGAPMVALAIGVILCLPLFGNEWNSKYVLNDLFNDGLKAAVLPMAITGAGGSLALLVRNTEVAERLIEDVDQLGIPALLIPFIVGAALNTITGSNILGMLTSAAIMAPMVDVLGVSALAVFLACGSGAQIMKHANSSGFWVTTTMSNLTLAQGIRSSGVATLISGVTSFIVVCILNAMGLV
ncbi:GntP family permease [Corynebacterium sp. Marseille-Q2823]|uniref:GntP family permease n=1 Tax=Corynebacterium sp. Marseille-Q2823 TaxID=2736606 RepID=UPI0015896442|nr:GntP family permease [Corynebacterium sp. Marseille-Q2823]